MTWWRRAQDTALALAVWLLDTALFSTAGADLGAARGGRSTLIIAGYVALGAVALIWRRRAPVAVFAWLWLHAVIGSVFVAGYLPTLPLMVAVYTVGAHLSRRRAWLIAPALVPYGVLAANGAWLEPPSRQAATFVGLLLAFSLLVGGVWALGRWAGASRRRLAAAEQQRVASAHAAVAAERARISRELHDIVAHTVTVMMLQASGAGRIMATRPEQARAALTQIEELGGQAMAELRRMLAVLAADAPAEAAAQPGLGDLDELLVRMRSAGMPVNLVVEGEPRQLDPSVGLAAYRTVQEALTNIAKHKGGDVPAVVRLVWADELLVKVTDKGAAELPRSPLSTGHGLLGLRERVAVAGGRLDAGPTGDGGFEVSAALPAQAARGGRVPVGGAR
ncbi:sensor histidine kinase [Catellatospora citrea]|uniref:histidine kinase n=1 Tax=Catellatospora citrea TaxID=53366 RepID=A0A8J3KDQ1_9ACTN|nr:histidine kinase [Catellatospora citrea]RKE10280.1 signal transduction histidine kinase [Catellatospora citrea]GIF97807.1 two-component sensor histidine kinase [Catellatospora citrea]